MFLSVLRLLSVRCILIPATLAPIPPSSLLSAFPFPALFFPLLFEPQPRFSLLNLYRLSQPPHPFFGTLYRGASPLWVGRAGWPPLVFSFTPPLQKCIASILPLFSARPSLFGQHLLMKEGIPSDTYRLTSTPLSQYFTLASNRRAGTNSRMYCPFHP